MTTQSHPYYPPGVPNPHHEYTYVERVQRALSDDIGEWVHVESVVGGDPWVIRESVEILRECGFEVESRHPLPGYRMLRWGRPRRWIRYENLCRAHLSAAVLYPPKVRRVQIVPGQVRAGSDGHLEIALELDAA